MSAAKEGERMKVLSVGNSFSEDAQRWLHEISLFGGERIDTFNLFIGGCSLCRHTECIEKGGKDYILQGNANGRLRETSANEIIENEKFDIVTVQQVSGLSGRPQTYEPYLGILLEYIKKHQPQAKIYFHETWSYEIDSTHGDFAFYNRDSGEMIRRISDCAAAVKRAYGIPVIPAGDFIEYLRENVSQFDYRGGGRSLCRDGFHLSLDYGRFAAAAVWYKTFTGETVKTEPFLEANPDFDGDLLQVIAGALDRFQAANV